MDTDELVRLCKKGDREAFGALVEEYQARIVNIAFGMLSDRDDAMDAAQETFIRIYRAIGGFNEKSSLSTWIYSICKNVCSDALRKRQRTIRGASIEASAADEDSKVIEPADADADPEQRYIKNERQRLVKKALSELKPEYREMITLYDLNGLSYEEIAEVLDIPIGTVKSRLSRARDGLKKKLLENRELF